jgi:hypothetical protein
VKLNGCHADGVAKDASIRTFEQRWSEAFVTGDAKALETMLDGEYVSVNARGQVRTKAEVVSAAVHYAASNPGAKASPLLPNVVIRIFGASAIVRHENVADRSIDVLNWRGGRWIAVYSQHTAMPSAQ